MAKQIYRKLSPNGPRPRTDGSFRPGDAPTWSLTQARFRPLAGARRYRSNVDSMKHSTGWWSETGSRTVWTRPSTGCAIDASFRVATSSTPTAKAEITHTLSVVVPAYDEAGNIERMVSDCLTHLPTFTTRFEVIVVNDGSRDGTREVVESLARRDSRVRPIHHPFNMGYGAAQKSGLRRHATTGSRLFRRTISSTSAISDDTSRYRTTQTSSVGCVLTEKEAADRRWVSNLYNRYIRSRYGIALSDLNWVKMYRGELLRQIEVETPGFSADAEVVIKLMKLGARVKELEVEHYPRTWGDETHVSLKNLATTAQELWTLSDKLRDV